MQHGRDVEHYHRGRKGKQESGEAQKLMDKLIYVVIIFGPLFTIPQIYQIFSSQDASGVSLVSWGAYCVGASFWLGYGILHREKPIILTNILLIFMNLFVLLGAFIYG